MTEWQEWATAPKDRKFLFRCDEEERTAWWDHDKKQFVLDRPVTYQSIQYKPVWKELSEPQK